MMPGGRPDRGEGISADLLGEPLPSCAEMRAWDERTIAAGTPGIELMERAGRGVVEVLRRRWSGELRDRRPVVVLVGPGNNGGDGLVIARLLREHGTNVKVVGATSDRYSPDFLTNLARLVERDVTIAWFGSGGPPLAGTPLESAGLADILTGSALVVDALLGTGQTRPPSGAIGAIVRVLGELPSSPPVVAVDIPTGIDGDTGVAHPGAVRADVTIAIGNTKRGLVQYPARELSGAIESIDIGLIAAPRPAFHRLSAAAHHLPARPQDCHKGHFGHVFIIGGSAAMPGAAALAARAALRTGAGWVTRTALAGAPTFETAEIMLVPLPPRPSGALEGGDLVALRSAIERATAVLIGPGLGLDTATGPLVFAVLELCRARGLPVVIDGDALTFLAHAGTEVDLSGCVLTPHPGEMARLVKGTTREVQCDRFGTAQRVADRCGAVVVLKGAGTVVTTRGGGVVCTRGTPYLATPGSGDVLAGIITALLAQGIAPADGAARGVAVHAVAGERAHRRTGGTIVASDITECIPAVIGSPDPEAR